jgi:hypothetical protein
MRVILNNSANTVNELIETYMLEYFKLNISARYSKALRTTPQNIVYIIKKIHRQNGVIFAKRKLILLRNADTMVIITPIFRLSIILMQLARIKAKVIEQKIIKAKVETIMEEE